MKFLPLLVLIFAGCSTFRFRGEAAYITESGSRISISSDGKEIVGGVEIRSRQLSVKGYAK